MILFEKMLARETSAETRQAMLAEKIAHSYATIIRQSYFVKFEVIAHEAIAQGITQKELSNIYYKTLGEQFGDAVEIDRIFEDEWATIPHIVNTPFYCYSYSFGELLALSLYSEYKERGAAYVQTIEKLLAAGGSREPAALLGEVGVDITSPDFWQGGFNIIRSWVDQLG